jgi:hypothetical protein
MTRKGPVIHGVLLAGALGLGWQTWTRDKTVGVMKSKVVVWRGAAADVTGLTVEKANGTTVVERKPEGYLWATTHGALQKAPPVPPDMMSQNPDSQPAAVPDEVHEFPVGDEGTKLFENLATFRAKRDVGAVTEDWRKSDYGITDKSDKLTLQTKSGPRVLLLGDNAYGTDDRYVYDDANKHVYLVAGDVIHSVTYPDTLKERKLHGFEPADVARATITAGGKTRALVKLAAKGMTSSWADASSPDKVDQGLGNFMDQVDGLVPTDYVADPGDLETVIGVDYDGKAGAVGKLALLKRPATPGPGTQPGQFDYFVRTERTRVLGKVSPQVATRVEQGVGSLFN